MTTPTRTKTTTDNGYPSYWGTPGFKALVQLSGTREAQEGDDTAFNWALTQLRNQYRLTVDEVEELYDWIAGATMARENTQGA